MQFRGCLHECSPTGMTLFWYKMETLYCKVFVFSNFLERIVKIRRSNETSSHTAVINMIFSGISILAE